MERLKVLALSGANIPLGIFTFQYGEIKRDFVCLHNGQVNCNLHSSMERLKAQEKAAARAEKAHLHSSMERLKVGIGPL